MIQSYVGHTGGHTAHKTFLLMPEVSQLREKFSPGTGREEADAGNRYRRFYQSFPQKMSYFLSAGISFREICQSLCFVSVFIRSSQVSPH